MRGRAMGVYGTMKDGHVKVGAIMVADDLVLATCMRNIHGMQNFLNNADEQRKIYILCEWKTTVQIINSKYQSNPAAKLFLNGKL